MTTILEILLDKYGPTLSTKELGEVLKMTPASIRTAISDETFPISTFRAGKQRLATALEVAEYLEKQRARTTTPASRQAA